MLTDIQFQTLAKLQERWSTDPMLKLARRLLDPEYESERFYVPEQLRYLTTVYITCKHRNWIDALNSTGQLSDVQLAYREAFIYLMDYLSEVVMFVKILLQINSPAKHPEVFSYFEFLRMTITHILEPARYIELEDSNKAAVYCCEKFSSNFIEDNYPGVIGMLSGLQVNAELVSAYRKCLTAIQHTATTLSNIGQIRICVVDLKREAEFFTKNAIGRPKKYFGNPFVHVI